MINFHTSRIDSEKNNKQKINLEKHKHMGVANNIQSNVTVEPLNHAFNLQI